MFEASTRDLKICRLQQHFWEIIRKIRRHSWASNSSHSRFWHFFFFLFIRE